MKCTLREDQSSGCVFENVFCVDSGAFSDASPGYSVFWETKHRA